MERRKSDVQRVFSRRRSAGDGYASSATQLESIAPTQAVAATDAHAPPPHLPLPARQQQQQQQQQRWGLPPEQAAYFASLDQECLLETASAQTTPAASRAASPGPAAAAAGFAGPCTAPQADLAAVITQQLASQRQHTPCSEEIRRHFPHVEERYQQYRQCMAEQALSPVRLREFFRHTEERGVPAL